MRAEDQERGGKAAGWRAGLHTVLRRARAGAATLLLVGAELAVAAGMAQFALQPAQAQFFWNDRDTYQQRERTRRAPPPQQGFSFPNFFGWQGPAEPRYQPNEREERVRRPRESARSAPSGDFSKAPAPKKADVEHAQNILVLGDAMADWLAYGLEDALSDTPELGVIRRHRTASSLIRNEPRDYDWVAGVKEALAGEKADFVVMMIGLGDRHAIRERPRSMPPAGAKPEDAKAGEAKPGDAKPAKPEDAAKAADAEAGEQPSIAAPERPAGGRPAAAISHEFRSERWVELYSKRVDEVIAALKAKGVPVIWVGLPPVRGPRARADLTFLNDLQRARAEKAGILYVDVWDGFVDDDGDFTNYGPDVIGQVRRLRSGDGVYFTKPGARKLAHYVDREVRRLLNRETPVALPVPDDAQKAAPDAAKPGEAEAPSGPPARPVAGPVIPLTGIGPVTEGLLGVRGERPADQGAAGQVLVKGEALEAPSGRADDFAWPRGAAAGNSDSEIVEPLDPIPAPVRNLRRGTAKNGARRSGIAVRRGKPTTAAAASSAAGTPATTTKPAARKLDAGR